jgi:hypothetical protein
MSTQLRMCRPPQLNGGELAVSQVYPQHGLRLGSVLRGTYTKAGGETALVAKKIKALKLKAGGTIELKKLCSELGLSQTDKSATL